MKLSVDHCCQDTGCSSEWGYRIAEKFGEDFNLAVWRIVKNRQIQFSPIIKHDVIRNTHAHRLSTLQRARQLQASLRKDCRKKR